MKLSIKGKYCKKEEHELMKIIVDNVFQVHERTEEMDFLLLVIRKLLRTNSQSVKVGSNIF